MFITTEVLPKKMAGFLQGSIMHYRGFTAGSQVRTLPEKSCVLNMIIFWQSAITLKKKVLMVKYAANVTQKKVSNSLPFAHIYLDVGQICRIETNRVRMGRKNHKIPLKQRTSMKEHVIN